MTVVVTGARGKVGSAIVAALRRHGDEVAEWNRPDYDLDDPSAAAGLVAHTRPSLVIHAAGWTDVDGCAREPELAMRRNGAATAELAHAAAAAGSRFVYVSTNEVFDGARTEDRGYAEDDSPAPPNAYGRSKLAGEKGVSGAYAGASVRAWIIRTSWVFGPPGNDFPTRIVAAVDGLEGPPKLQVVGDERGRPTYAPDFADALLALMAVSGGGTYHLANEEPASRFEWARKILAHCRPNVEVEEISLADYARPSVPPSWGVLDTGRAAAAGVTMRPWREPLGAYLAELCP